MNSIMGKWFPFAQQEQQFQSGTTNWFADEYDMRIPNITDGVCTNITDGYCTRSLAEQQPQPFQIYDTDSEMFFYEKWFAADYGVSLIAVLLMTTIGCFVRLIVAYELHKPVIPVEKRVHDIIGFLSYIAAVIFLLSPIQVTLISSPDMIFSANVQVALAIATGHLLFEYLTFVHRSNVEKMCTTAITCFSWYCLLVEVIFDAGLYLPAILPAWIGLRFYSFMSACYISAEVPVESLSVPSEGPKPPSLLWRVHGKVYDLEKFVPMHPGGTEAILLARGERDATALFESYHPFTSKESLNRVLAKYEVKELCQEEKTTDAAQAHKPQQPKKLDQKNVEGELVATEEEEDDADVDEFYELLKKRAYAAFREHGLDPKRDRGANLGRVFQYVVIGAASMLFGYFHFQGSFLGTFCLSWSGWLMGALGHDGGHFSVSRKPWINELSVNSLFFIVNPIVWQHQHTFAHHSFTNDFDHDPDLHHFVHLRVHRMFPQDPKFAMQIYRAYVMFAYLFTIWGTCLLLPLEMMQEATMHHVVKFSDRQRPARFAIFWLHWVAYFAFIVVVPFWVRKSYTIALAQVATHMATSGVLFSIMTQINHINEPCLQWKEDRVKELKARNPTGCADFDKIQSTLYKSWAVDQIESSNNFALHSFFWFMLSNGLNYQIEHHLFPGINHCHLWIFAPVVEATCKEFGIVYKNYETLGEIVDSTADWYEKLAEEPQMTKGNIVA